MDGPIHLLDVRWGRKGGPLSRGVGEKKTPSGVFITKTARRIEVQGDAK